MVAPMITLARARFGPIKPWDICVIVAVAITTILGACHSVSGSNGPRVPADLLQRARRSGEVKVIVQLRVDPGASEQTIEATKLALLGEIANTEHKVVRELRGLPLIALEASYATLMVLDSSPRVLRVEEDSLARPQG
jgi:hypothetical protein